MIAISHMLHKQFNNCIFEKQIKKSNGYLGGNTKFALNFASFKFGSNFRYMITVINIFITLLLTLLIIIQHKGIFLIEDDEDETKVNIMSFVVYPVLICLVQIVYAALELYEQRIILDGRRSNQKKSLDFKETTSLYTNIVLWIVLIVYLILGQNLTMLWFTLVIIIISIVFDYINVSCRNRAVSFFFAFCIFSPIEISIFF